MRLCHVLIEWSGKPDGALCCSWVTWKGRGGGWGVGGMAVRG